MKFSIVICTWNRAELLKQTLQQLKKLNVAPGDIWQLIVVDNNSQDNTQEVIEEYKPQLPLLSLFEEKAGKSYAANLALHYVEGDLLIWMDDDVIVDPNLATAYLQAADNHPNASYFCGRIEPWYESPPAGWIARHIQRLRGVYAICDHGAEERLLKEREAVFGANMAFRTEVAKDFPLNPHLGRIEKQLIGGDDTELVSRVRNAGHQGVWAPNAMVKHYIPASRLSREYVRRWYFDAGVKFARTTADEVANNKTIGGAPRWLWSKLLRENVVLGALEMLKNERWLEAFKQTCISRGAINEFARLANSDQMGGSVKVKS